MFKSCSLADCKICLFLMPSCIARLVEAPATIGSSLCSSVWVLTFKRLAKKPRYGFGVLTGDSTTSLYWFLHGGICRAGSSSLALILLWIQLTKSSLRPTLPQRCKDRSPWLLVKRSHMNLIAGSIKPVYVKLMCTKYVLYLISFTKHSMT
mgnify:CR=1 FL=1